MALKKKLQGEKKKKKAPALLNSTHSYKLDTANLARAPNIALFVHIWALETYVYDGITVESEGF